MNLKEFKKLPLLKYFQHDLEAIKMAFRLSDSIRADVGNIRAAGDQVELAVKDFYANKLFPKYHVSDGHLVDSNLKISPQYDVIISENSKNPVLFDLADKSQLIYFDSVFCFGEIKRSFYNKSLLNDFTKNLQRLRQEMARKDIPANFIEAGNAGFEIETPVTELPLRNPIFSFMFFVSSSKMNSSELRNTFATCDNKYLPNFIVLLDQGIIVNVDKESFDSRKPVINLYPEFALKPTTWKLINLRDENDVLIFQYMLLIQHLNVSVVSIPDVREYTEHLFDIPMTSYYDL